MPEAYFSLPGRSPGKAIALPPASTLALDSASPFPLKFSRANIINNLVHIWFDYRYRS